MSATGDAPLVAALADLRETVARDAGELWGRPLNGPVMLVDPATRRIFANAADAGGLLVAGEGGFTGTLPRDVNLANTALEWSGTRWAMVVLPLPAEPMARRAMLVHESWHREQPHLDLPARGDECVHLGTMEARVWLQLEMRALAAALRADGGERHRAARDAVLFRLRRQQMHAGSAAAETDLENNEGLAEYTGLRLSGLTPLAPAVAGLLESFQGRESYVRNFAYATGPAYGLVLDALQPDWRGKIRAGVALSELVLTVPGIDPVPGDRELASAAEDRAAAYDAVSLRAAEEQRAEIQARQAEAARQKFVAGPVLVVPLSQPRVQFNPNTLQPLGELGTVYPTLRVVDEWGVLDVRDGALLARNWKRVTVSAVGWDAARRDTSAWSLELNPGWEIIPGESAGSWQVRRQ